MLLLLFLSVGAYAYAESNGALDLERDSSQYASISDASQTGLDITGNMTIECWIKLESLPGSGYEYTFVGKKNPSGGQRSYFFYLYNNSGTYSLRYSAWSDGSTGAEGVVTWTPSTATWYHVAAAYNASGGTVDFYVNGTQQGAQQSGLPNSVYNGSADLIVGAYSGPDGFFDGLIDEVRIWSTTRTQAQVNDNKSVAMTSSANLQGSWHFNGSYADSSGNGNIFTATAGPTFSTDAAFDPGTVVIRKSVDESVTSSTTLQDDDELLIAVRPKLQYVVDGVVFATSASVTPDIKIAFTAPSGSTIDIGYVGMTGTASAQADILETSGSASASIPVDADKVTVILIHGTIKLDSTAGFLQLRWAQNTSNGTAVTIKEGSYLKVGEI